MVADGGRRPGRVCPRRGAARRGRRTSPRPNVGSSTAKTTDFVPRASARALSAGPIRAAKGRKARPVGLRDRVGHRHEVVRGVGPGRRANRRRGVRAGEEATAASRSGSETGRSARTTSPTSPGSSTTYTGTSTGFSSRSSRRGSCPYLMTVSRRSSPPCPAAGSSGAVPDTEVQPRSHLNEGVQNNITRRTTTATSRRAAEATHRGPSPRPCRRSRGRSGARPITDALGPPGARLPRDLPETR